MAATGSKPTLDQRRAKHAWGVVQQAKQLDERSRKDFGRNAKKLPIRIHTAGLGHALAFLEAKRKAKELYDALSAWVLQERLRLKERSLIEAIIGGDSDRLRRATDEALAYLQWLNRFAEAEGLVSDEED
ncbi:MAG: type III-B CRISPR module-associated protein Cmr5 [Myxococcales bacterium]|nr:type III-B CRISPR module-associated protein Cmr5 [Myxococcales bacterium]